MHYSDQYGSFPKTSLGKTMNLDFLESDEEQEMLASIDWSNYVFPQPEPI